MPRKTVKDLDAEQNADSRAIAELFEMIKFLEKNPQYTIDDYLNEFPVRVETLVKLGR
jgi:hypothetical protein